MGLAEEVMFESRIGLDLWSPASCTPERLYREFQAWVREGLAICEGGLPFCLMLDALYDEAQGGLRGWLVRAEAVQGGLQVKAG